MGLPFWRLSYLSSTNFKWNLLWELDNFLVHCNQQSEKYQSWDDAWLGYILQEFINGAKIYYN